MTFFQDCSYANITNEIFQIMMIGTVGQRVLNGSEEAQGIVCGLQAWILQTLVLRGPISWI